MKKLILLAVMAVLFIACSSDDVSSNADYTFTTTLTVTCSPNIQGYPQTTTAVTQQKGITAEQAKKVAEGLTTTNTATTGGYTITSKMTCVYVLTKNYVAPTGARVVN
jgi:hypothetical protein